MQRTAVSRPMACTMFLSSLVNLGNLFHLWSITNEQTSALNLAVTSAIVLAATLRRRSDDTGVDASPVVTEGV